MDTSSEVTVLLSGTSVAILGQSTSHPVGAHPSEHLEDHLCSFRSGVPALTCHFLQFELPTKKKTQTKGKQFFL